MAYRASHISDNFRTNTAQNVSPQMSTTSCLNACHSAYTSAQSFSLESSTSLVVNTWVTGSSTGPDGRYGGTVDAELARRAWEHARRRAEDGCILLGSLHRSTPSLLAPFVSALPLSVPGSFYTALNALRPFLHTVTPYNPSMPRHAGISSVFTLTLAGELAGASISLSTSGIDTKQGLLEVPAEKGYRAFDAFYYLLISASSEQEREYLGLKPASQYSLLHKSETYTPPSYLPTADDAASAEDFRESLKTIGIKGKSLRSLLSVTAAILRLGDALGFLVDQEELETTCEEVGELLELNPEVLLKKCVTEERGVLIAAIYEALVDWVVMKANEAIRAEIKNVNLIGSSSGSEAGAATPMTELDEDSVSITVIEVPSQQLGKAASLKTVFDDSTGINAEMKEDGVPAVAAGTSVIREMKDAVSQSEPDLDIMTGPLGKEREVDLDRRHGILEKVGPEVEQDGFLRRLLYPIDGEGIVLGKHGRFNLSQVLGSSRVWFQLCLHPSDEPPSAFANTTAQSSPWSAGSVSSQIRTWRLPEWANHRNKQLDFTADFDIDEFFDRYQRLGCQAGRDGVESWIMERGWTNGEVIVGQERVWMRESAWWEAESMLDMKPVEDNMLGGLAGMDSGYPTATPSGLENPFFQGQYTDSKDNLTIPPNGVARSVMGARSLAPTHAQTMRSGGGDYGLGFKGDDTKGMTYDGEIDQELMAGKHIEEQKITFGRRAWVFAAYAITFWCPSFVLKYVGRMKRPDVRLAWREKILLISLIFLLNAAVIFWIVEFGNLLCPNMNKVWNQKEVSYHQGDNDYWVSYRGNVYDLSKFWKLQHSDTNIQTTQDLMQPFAGTDVTPYITPPLTIACPGLGIGDDVQLQSNTTITNSAALHQSGPIFQPDTTTKLHNIDWYPNDFLPRMKEYYKGPLVTLKKDIYNDGQNNAHYWVIIDGDVYDLSDYFFTLNRENNLAMFKFFPDDVTTLIQQNPGEDVSTQFHALKNATARANSLNCMKNYFYAGQTDFRKSARCQVNNWILLAFTIILASTILVKFLAALQLGSKRRPAQQDKFVICQVPAYTEGEDSLRKGLDSLTALAYDNKRKLICVVCDGMIVGGGNDRPTPKIVLDILGVDPKVDPPALPFRSVGQGSDQLNYGKVYSGLYEFEGNVVPYLVVVKVGKESEQSKSKPGNRGKRDSQVLLMSFLNRVHHRSAMSPLELEMFHQINNIIGVDPELYEYLFMVDADTKVKEDSLNRLVAACANDAKIAGVCGETSLENEERSWWTMIQVYEYYISHHLAKAFESLFGSVTCLPGCFCMYRLRTADKGRPLIISDKVIDEYSDINIDTLHKKNLLSLGEDRYLTTLMTKHFPAMSYKFVPDAYALTEAPAEWGVLLSQRRRWINSTVHNLAELVFLKDLCGFCCFSMRFVVFIDLFGTIILPATCGYLAFLIYRVASHTGQFPLISIIIIAVVYGLQAIIFLIKRQWQHIGWMIIYIIAYPIWSFVLPVYSFWKMDDFSWGNTRIVIGEKGDKKVVAVENEVFDPRSIPLQRWDDYAIVNNLPGRRGMAQEKDMGGYRDGYEMDDMQSVYSSVKPASTILTGFPQQQMHRPPPSPSAYGALNRQSTYSRYTDTPAHMEQQQRLMSIGGMSDAHAQNQSQDNLSGLRSPPLYQQRAASPAMGPYAQNPYSRPGSTNNLNARMSVAGSLPGFQTQGVSNEAITHAIRECLQEVDLDSVTKKQLKALTEQKLQCQLPADKRAFLDSQIDQELANM
ncbi:Chitin synthase 6 [Acrodontium crateriforme]|uniref:chitin synthase n=1 Tax=Acrodontium crateriforme TaxID=150365 RepID=A0AAQ3LXP9_9PEZI|nr:Chitin synthase 6 [Acrodontium crateriforme]